MSTAVTGLSGGPPSKVFHYAPRSYLSKIVACGFLRCSNADGADLRPLLWFSKHPHWEPTATKFIRERGVLRPLTFEEQKDAHGCIRFGLAATDRRLLSWPNACKYAGITSKLRLQMERSAFLLGASPAHWYAVAEPLDLSEMTFQVLERDQWIDADPVVAERTRRLRGDT